MSRLPHGCHSVSLGWVNGWHPAGCLQTDGPQCPVSPSCGKRTLLDTTRGHISLQASGGRARNATQRAWPLFHTDPRLLGRERALGAGEGSGGGRGLRDRRPVPAQGGAGRLTLNPSAADIAARVTGGWSAQRACPQSSGPAGKRSGPEPVITHNL